LRSVSARRKVTTETPLFVKGKKKKESRQKRMDLSIGCPLKFSRHGDLGGGRTVIKNKIKIPRGHRKEKGERRNE